MTKPMNIDPHYTPCPAHDGDELFPNGFFVFNVTAILAFLENNPEAVPLTEVAVAEFCRENYHLDPAEVAAFDLTRPVVLAEIAPGRYNLIDGQHRMEKARRLGIDTMMAYKLTAEMHVAFLTSRKAYLAYVEYWNGKLEKPGNPRP
jgi:hypothetical protein